MSGRENSRWRFAILPIVVFIILAPRLAKQTGLHMPSPVVLLICAAMIVVAAVFAGVHAWRSATVPHA